MNLEPVLNWVGTCICFSFFFFIFFSGYKLPLLTPRKILLSYCIMLRIAVLLINMPLSMTILSSMFSLWCFILYAVLHSISVLHFTFVIFIFCSSIQICVSFYSLENQPQQQQRIVMKYHFAARILCYLLHFLNRVYVWNFMQHCLYLVVPYLECELTGNQGVQPPTTLIGNYISLSLPNTNTNGQFATPVNKPSHLTSMTAWFTNTTESKSINEMFKWLRYVQHIVY